MTEKNLSEAEQWMDSEIISKLNIRKEFLFLVTRYEQKNQINRIITVRKEFSKNVLVPQIKWDKLFFHNTGVLFVAKPVSRNVIENGWIQKLKSFVNLNPNVNLNKLFVDNSHQPPPHLFNPHFKAIDIYWSYIPLKVLPQTGVPSTGISSRSFSKTQLPTSSHLL